MPENVVIARSELGLIIHGTYPSPSVLSIVSNELQGSNIGLAILDPPYGNILSETWDKVGAIKPFVRRMLHWVSVTGKLMEKDSALLLWGGIGIENFRPLYLFLAHVEQKTDFSIANHITWSKKRAYGVSHNYLFTREELIYMTKGNPKTPRVFNIPLLKEIRGYPGYNSKYPAKSPYKRRTNVWTDATELFKDKLHPAQKPNTVYEVIIQTHSNVEDIILDPFAGSGVTGEVATQLGRRFILVENDLNSFKIICNRLKARMYTSYGKELKND